MAVPDTGFHADHADPVCLLYICYLGIEEPLVETQVVPYLDGLAAQGYGVVLLTFEPHRLSKGARRRHHQALRARRIEWHTLRYHKRPALPATFADIVAGIGYGAYLIRTRRIAVVHARSHVPAAMALILRQLVGTRFVFDIRGLLADEYVDAGLWRKGGVLFRLVKRMEHVLLARADGAIVITRRARQWLFDVRNASAKPVEIVPCCVDLRRFAPDAARVQRLRMALALDRGWVLAYVGKLGGWYMTREMVDFYCAARRHFPDLRFLVLTQSAAVMIEREFARRGVARDSYRCLSVPPEDVPVYLALADFAICLNRRCLSGIASSPAKIGEYLAAGLPVVYNTGIGDLDDLEEEQVGVMIDAFSEAEYARAARRVRLLVDGRAAAHRCRAAAERLFSLQGVGIPRYLRLYSALPGVRIPGTAAAASPGSGVR